MAEAIINGCMIRNVQSLENTSVYDPSKERLKFLKEHYPQVRTTGDINEAMKDADVIVLAFKPQNLETVAKHVDLKGREDTIVLSILAGVAIEDIERELHSNRVIRSMPNTPAMALEGMTVWYAQDSISRQDRDKVQTLFSAFGEEVEVAEEKYLDMATAISGSGPAYIFLAIEAMVDASVHLGFPRDTATKLVFNTLIGSAKYAAMSPEGVAVLKNNVTSPGGTTASALYELERGKFKTVLSDAIWASYRRALELGNKNSNVGPGRSGPTR